MSTESIFSSEEPGLEEILTSYLYAGFTYTEILEFLNVYHGQKISLSTLKRRFKALGLHRRPLVPWRATIKEVNNAVQKELDASGSNLGCSRIWASLKRQKILVRKKDVGKAILELNAEGVQQRKRRKFVSRIYGNLGPNYVWHIDGHDKLKPFDFSVHGCIDGFSRKLIWLEVTSVNTVSEIISQYYLKAVKRFKSVPKKIKAHDGTEHSLIEPIHIYLRSLNDDKDGTINSFSIVSSPVN